MTTSISNAFKVNKVNAAMELGATQSQGIIKDILGQLRANTDAALLGAQFDAAVAAGARFVISPGMTPALLAHAAKSTAPLIPGVATPSEVMQALEAGYDHLKFFPAEANGGTKALSAIAAPLPQVRFCPTGGIGPKNVADYLALKCVATVGGSWMLPADAVKSGNWEEVTRLSREAVEMVKR